MVISPYYRALLYVAYSVRNYELKKRMPVELELRRATLNSPFRTSLCCAIPIFMELKQKRERKPNKSTFIMSIEC